MIVFLSCFPASYLLNFLTSVFMVSEQAVSRVLFPPSVTLRGAMIITLGRQLPDASSDRPGSSGGPPSNAPLCGLAPDGVCRASPVTRGTGELLPRLFTLTFRLGLAASLKAVCFLWHFPWGRPRSPLATILPYGARTFLRPGEGPAIIPPAPTRAILRCGAEFCND